MATAVLQSCEATEAESELNGGMDREILEFVSGIETLDDAYCYLKAMLLCVGRLINDTATNDAADGTGRGGYEYRIFRLRFRDFE